MFSDCLCLPAPGADARASGRPAGCSRWWVKRADWDRASRPGAADRTMCDDDDDDDGHVRAYGRGRDEHAALPAAPCAAAAVAARHKPENVLRNGRPAQWHLE